MTTITLRDPRGGGLQLTFGDEISISAGVAGLGLYNGWPQNTVRYDSGRDQLNTMGTTGAVHNEMGTASSNYDKRSVLFRKPNASAEDMSSTVGSYLDPVVIYSEPVGTSCMSQAFCVLSNGDYGVIVGRVDHPNTWFGTKDAVWRTSADGGATWSGGVMTGHGSSYPCGLFQTSSGRLIGCTPQNTTFGDPITTWQRMLRSDDLGSSWSGVNLNSSLHRPDFASNRWTWEPVGVELDEGTLLYMLRGDRLIGADQYQALYCLSPDGGDTFSPLRQSNLPMQANPVDIKKLPDGRLLAFTGSRHVSQHGIYASLTTQAHAKRGIWGPLVKITAGASSSDFGYPGYDHDGVSRLWLAYYKPSSPNTTDIFERRATFS